jgi:hypothetical protein
MRTLGALLAVLLITGPVLAGGRHADEPLAFSAVPDYGAPDARAALVRDVAVIPSDVRPVRPGRRVHAPVLRQIAHISRSAGGSVQPASGLSRRGVASWYCCTRGYPSGLYAAAGPALRVGHWRGRTVWVALDGRSVPVTLIDWCLCGHGRVIDLYPAAFSRLAPLNRGLVKVTVNW